MAREVTTRSHTTISRPRGTDGRARATTVKRKAEKVRTMPTTETKQLAERLAAMDGAIRTGAYRLLGRIFVMEMQRGTVEYRGDGPMVAQANPGADLASGTLLILDPWQGFPNLHDAGNELCPKCQATCDECKAGKRPCVACGGAGVSNAKRKTCAAKGCAVEKGRTNLACTTCGGRGDVIDPQKCVTCEGSGKADCGLCQGTGKMSTGKEDGSTKRDAKECTECDGSRRKRGEREQAWTKHLNGRMDSKIVLGPITRIVVHNAGGDEKLMLPIAVDPDQDGQNTVLLLDNVKPGSKMWFLGGRITVPR